MPVGFSDSDKTIDEENKREHVRTKAIVSEMNL